MSKVYYPPPQIVPVQTNATTASPSIVKAITLERTPAGLKSIGKAEVKFSRPTIPEGAVRKVIDSIEVHTVTAMTDEEERLLRADLAAILGR